MNVNGGRERWSPYSPIPHSSLGRPDRTGPWSKARRPTSSRLRYTCLRFFRSKPSAIPRTTPSRPVKRPRDFDPTNSFFIYGLYSVLYPRHSRTVLDLEEPSIRLSRAVVRYRVLGYILLVYRTSLTMEVQFGPYVVTALVQTRFVTRPGTRLGLLVPCKGKVVIAVTFLSLFTLD